MYKRWLWFLFMMLSFVGFCNKPLAVSERNVLVPISLNFQNIDVRKALHVLAEFKGMNLVVSDSVKGNITLRLQEVPWEDALNIILTSQGLGARRQGNVLLIDKASVLSHRWHDVLETQRIKQGLSPLFSTVVPMNYAKATDMARVIADKRYRLLSERGVLRADKRTNTLWLQDTVARIKKIKALITQWDKPVQQVLIEARIVDLSKQCEEDLGVRWGLIGAEGAATTPKGPISWPGSFVERLNLDLAATPNFGAPAALGMALAKLGNGILLDLELSALESEGRAEIIARPRLMVINRQAAVISSGQDIPYQQSALNGATTVAFKKAVLSLKATPQIMPDGHLLMDLLITQDADSGQRVQGVPVILTKSIQTNVRVFNGQTIVLGGIYKKDTNNTITRVPFLGHLPVVGHLFSKVRTKIENDELLIFITPKIIGDGKTDVV